MLGDGVLDRLRIQRRVEVGDPRRRLWVTSVPDQVLRNLDWYRRGGEVSDRQWRDVAGLLVTHLDNLDLADLRQVAEESDLSDLLERALLQAGEDLKG